MSALGWLLSAICIVVLGRVTHNEWLGLVGAWDVGIWSVRFADTITLRKNS